MAYLVHRDAAKMSLHARIAVVLLACAASGCASWRDAGSQESSESLTQLVAELHVHLREDTYRYARPRSADGRDLLETGLWKLERLQRARARDAGENWEPADQIIAFARARTLERLRRYEQAAAAFDEVARHDSVLAEPARESAVQSRRLAAASGVAVADSADPEVIDARIRSWQQLVWELRGTHYASLAREELEAWQVLRVERLAGAGELDAALDACERLVEANRESKHVGRHLVRLGDLYAQAARLRAAESAVAEPESLRAAVSRTDRLVERAFSAWELAAETRDLGARVAAESRMRALDADLLAGGRHAP